MWAPQPDPTQWSSAYYGYGQGYDAYAYGATQDPSLYAYGAYGGYVQYPQQASHFSYCYCISFRISLKTSYKLQYNFYSI